MSARQHNRLHAKLERDISEGKFYEAHQIYLTLYSRYLTSKGLPEAGQLLFDAIHLFKENKQIESTQEFAIKWVEHLKTYSVPLTEEILSQVTSICTSLMELQPSSDSPDTSNHIALKFMRTSIKWSINFTNSAHQYGHPRLHYHIAKVLWNSKNYKEARFHYIHSDCTEEFLLLVVELSVSEGYKSEAQLFLSHIIFRMLGYGYYKNAVIAYHTFVSNHPLLVKGKFPWTDQPLLNLLYMLLEVVTGEEIENSDQLDVCQYLCSQYIWSIQIDPSLLDTISQFGFISLHKPNAPTSLLSNINVRTINDNETLD